MHQDIKLTVHESGQCHIKIKYKSLCRFKDSPTNQDTYIQKWFLSNSKARLSERICRIIIPASSLSYSEFTKTPNSIINLSDSNKTVHLCCFLTSPRPFGETLETDSKIVYKKQLPNLKYFVVAYDESNSYIDAEADMQATIIESLKEKGVWGILPNNLYGVATAYNQDENLYSLVQYRLNK